MLRALPAGRAGRLSRYTVDPAAGEPQSIECPRRRLKCFDSRRDYLPPGGENHHQDASVQTGHAGAAGKGEGAG